MKLVYKNAGDHSNIEMSSYFKTAKQTIDVWSANPSQMFVSEKDVFLRPFIPDLVLETLQSSALSSIVEVVLKEILPAIAAVIEKQLSRYISGDLSEPSQELLEKTVSAAPHNIWAERVVGMTCHLWKRCPMATIGFLDAKIKAKTNKLMEWLGGKDEAEQEKLVAFGRKRAGLLRKKRRENEKGIDDEIEIRMNELTQMRSKKSRRKADKEVEAAYKKRDADAVVFQSVSGFQREWLVQLTKQDGMIVGALFQHKWYDGEMRKDCIWQARVVKIGKKTTTAYWCADGNEDDVETGTADSSD
ncbi:hypothetical protein EGW08_004071 [Elysia chlorotica]|uniref:Uncharacterized protein n=1 Tax=Elysia chlorotica TaxID=188477 RepID=A0A3S1BP28_ELYCH|nr:hypothetical protein EGW08_004071 [Elysia chlorotica]